MFAYKPARSEDSNATLEISYNNSVNNVDNRGRSFPPNNHMLTRGALKNPSMLLQ